MCGFIAQLADHRTGIAEVTGSNPAEALIFSGFFFPIAYIGKFTANIFELLVECRCVQTLINAQLNISKIRWLKAYVNVVVF